MQNPDSLACLVLGLIVVVFGLALVFRVGEKAEDDMKERVGDKHKKK